MVYLINLETPDKDERETQQVWFNQEDAELNAGALSTNDRKYNVVKIEENDIQPAPELISIWSNGLKFWP